MLYPVPDRKKTYAEVRRVLKPNGLFFATANGRSSMRQLKELEEKIGIERGVLEFYAAADFFLENGEKELAAWFSLVEMRRSDEALLVTEVQPLIDYVSQLSADQGWWRKWRFNSGIASRLRSARVGRSASIGSAGCSSRKKDRSGCAKDVTAP